MSDPTFVDIEHGTASWDATVNDNMNKVRDNFARTTRNADHGQKWEIVHYEAESPALSGASYTFTGIVPAGSLLLAVTGRVTTAITGASSTDVGDGTTANKYGDNVANALGTTFKGPIIPAPQAAAGDVVLTANGSNFTGGKMRVTVVVMEFTPPTG